MRWLLAVGLTVLVVVAGWWLRAPAPAALPGRERLEIIGAADPGSHGVPLARSSPAAIPVTSVTAAPTTVGGTVTPDPTVEALLPESSPDPRALYSELRHEGRDPGWAARSEQAIRNELASVPAIGGSNPLKVTCGGSLCELAGEMSPGASIETLNAASSRLQSPDFNARLATQGLTFQVGTFGGGNTRSTFVFYYRRGAGPR